MLFNPVIVTTHQSVHRAFFLFEKALGPGRTDEADKSLVMVAIAKCETEADKSESSKKD